MPNYQSSHFLDLLQLRNQRFSHVSLDGLLISIFDFADSIWEGQRLYEFVDHGIDHSFRVAQIAMEIMEKIAPGDMQLTPIERFVLGAGTLIHDIGMQYNKYPLKGTILDHKEIRENHCQLGYEMIQDALKGSFQKERGGPSILSDEYSSIFINHAASIGFSHSGSKYWDLLKNNIYEERKEGGLETFRPRLLASILRLADEFHTEWTRIPHLNMINIDYLTDEQKAHWAACCYIQELKLSSPYPGGGGLRITLKWMVPKEASEEERELIRTLLQELRERKVTSEFDTVKTYLKWKEGMEECFFEYVMDTIPQPSSIQTLPNEVKNYVIKSLRPYQFGSKKLVKMIKANEIEDGLEVDNLKNIAQDFYLSGGGTLRGHYRLNTGWHTNVFVRCRQLVANNDFSNRLAYTLAEKYKNSGITDIISIGTSAIRIGSFLSFLLNTNYSYTFTNPISKNNNELEMDYSDYEKKFNATAHARVLLIDDILGMGNVIEYVSNTLMSRNLPPSKISAFCIFALGTLAESVEKLSNIEIEYLVSFPDVSYFKGNSETKTCDICKNNPLMIREG